MTSKEKALKVLAGMAELPLTKDVKPEEVVDWDRVVIEGEVK